MIPFVFLKILTFLCRCLQADTAKRLMAEGDNCLLPECFQAHLWDEFSNFSVSKYLSSIFVTVKEQNCVCKGSKES